MALALRFLLTHDSLLSSLTSIPRSEERDDQLKSRPSIIYPVGALDTICS